MFWQRFNWLILSLFLIQAFLPAKHFVNPAFYFSQPAFVSAGIADQEEDDASPLELIFEDYLDFIEELPKKDMGRVGKTRTVKLLPAPLLKEVRAASLQFFISKESTPLAYKPLGFLLSEYHGYLFRLTPF